MRKRRGPCLKKVLKIFFRKINRQSVVGGKRRYELPFVLIIILWQLDNDILTKISSAAHCVRISLPFENVKSVRRQNHRAHVWAFSQSSWSLIFFLLSFNFIILFIFITCIFFREIFRFPNILWCNVGCVDLLSYPSLIWPNCARLRVCRRPLASPTSSPILHPS